MKKSSDVNARLNQSISDRHFLGEVQVLEIFSRVRRDMSQINKHSNEKSSKMVNRNDISVLLSKGG